MCFLKSKRAICAILVLITVQTICNVQPVLADEGDTALTGLDDSNPVSGNSGTSEAGVAFEGGDLSLVQVPNLDFGKVKLGTNADMISSRKQQRVAVVTDTRVDSGVSDSAFNWNLSVTLGYFMANNDPSTKVDFPLKFTLKTSSNLKPSFNPIFDPGNQVPTYDNKSGAVIQDDSVPYEANGVISAKDNDTYVIINGAHRGGTTAVNLGPSGSNGYVHIYTAAANDNDHLQMNEKTPIPYLANLTWTLSTDATQSN